MTEIITHIMVIDTRTSVSSNGIRRNPMSDVTIILLTDALREKEFDPRKPIKVFRVHL